MLENIETTPLCAIVPTNNDDVTLSIAKYNSDGDFTHHTYRVIAWHFTVCNDGHAVQHPLIDYLVDDLQHTPYVIHDIRGKTYAINAAFHLISADLTPDAADVEPYLMRMTRLKYIDRLTSEFKNETEAQVINRVLELDAFAEKGTPPNISDDEFVCKLQRLLAMMDGSKNDFAADILTNFSNQASAEIFWRNF